MLKKRWRAHLTWPVVAYINLHALVAKSLIDLSNFNLDAIYIITSYYSNILALEFDLACYGMSNFCIPNDIKDCGVRKLSLILIHLFFKSFMIPSDYLNNPRHLKLWPLLLFPYTSTHYHRTYQSWTLCDRWLFGGLF
jgi:hypothetical protein